MNALPNQTQKRDTMLFGKLNINPARNPAILDTATWSPDQAWDAVQSVADDHWSSLQLAVTNGSACPPGGGLTLYPSSFARHHGARYCLASLADGQLVFIQVGDGQVESALGAPVGVKSLPAGGYVALHPTDARVVDRFLRLIKSEKGPRALKEKPALGIGTRMTTAVWPGIWRAMAAGGFAANAIQNSVRELNALENLLAARPAEQNTAFNFGVIETGYSGSTYEGLWVAGVLDALKSDGAPHYEADADHLQVKRVAGGLARAKQHRRRHDDLVTQRPLAFNSRT